MPTITCFGSSVLRETMPAGVGSLALLLASAGGVTGFVAGDAGGVLGDGCSVDFLLQEVTPRRHKAKNTAKSDFIIKLDFFMIFRPPQQNLETTFENEVLTKFSEKSNIIILYIDALPAKKLRFF